MRAAVRSAALVIVWSSGFIGAELGARAALPATILAWRFLVTAAFLMPWLLTGGRLDRREWVRQGVLALLCQCLYLAGVFWAAAAGVPAGTSALIASLQPGLVLAAAALLGSRRLTFGHIAGLLLGSTGVALTAAADLRAGVSVPALALPLGAMLSLTVGTMLAQRWSTLPGNPRPGNPPPGNAPPGNAPPGNPRPRNQTSLNPAPLPLMRTLAIQAVFSAAFFTSYTAAAGDLAPPPTIAFWTATGWSALAGIGSYGLYYLVTSSDGAARASTLLYLTPAATALWATLMFGQPLRLATIIGLLVSAAAVLVLSAATRRHSDDLRQPDSSRSCIRTTSRHVGADTLLRLGRREHNDDVQIARPTSM